MAESESGLDVMRSRIKRASRKPPPPRGATVSDAPVPAAPVSETEPEKATPVSARPTSTPAAARPKPRRGPGTPKGRPHTISPTAPSVNLAIRVRQPLDDRLVDLLHSLRHAGVRSSKVELIEMLLWELPESPNDELRARLSDFRQSAPRGTGSSAEL